MIFNCCRFPNYIVSLLLCVCALVHIELGVDAGLSRRSGDTAGNDTALMFCMVSADLSMLVTSSSSLLS